MFAFCNVAVFKKKKSKINLVLRYNNNNNNEQVRKTQKIPNKLSTLSTKTVQSGHRVLQHTFRTLCIASIWQIQKHYVFQLYRQQQQQFSKQDLFQSPQVFRTRNAFIAPHEKKYNGVMSGDRVGHATGPLRPVHLFRNTSSSNWRALAWWCAGAPSCRYIGCVLFFIQGVPEKQFLY